MYINRLKEMFTEMVVKKDVSAIPHYYHQEFLLYTNGEVIDYDNFYQSHQRYYATDISYEISYDEEAWLEQEEKLAGRVWITTSRPSELAQKIEVILIAHFKQNKIYRLWELTYPDWSQLSAFKEGE